MTKDDKELRTTLDRLCSLQDQLARLHEVETGQANLALSSSGYLQEIERLQREVSDYLGPDPDDTVVDDLLQTNSDFQALVARSKAGPRKPFVPGSDT